MTTSREPGSPVAMNSELKLPSGVPVTRNIRTAYAGDQPVEVMETISNGEAVSYRFEIQV
jgi:hypothetical protein